MLLPALIIITVFIEGNCRLLIKLNYISLSSFDFFVIISVKIVQIKQSNNNFDFQLPHM